MFGINRVDFRERQENAIRRALKATRLTTKEIAYSLGVDGDTFLSWSKGAGTLNGAAIDALDRLFCSCGYFGFIEDIYGHLFALRRERAAELEQQAAKLRAIGSLGMAAA
jgi:hypothetical protein